MSRSRRRGPERIYGYLKGEGGGKVAVRSVTVAKAIQAQNQEIDGLTKRALVAEIQRDALQKKVDFLTGHVWVKVGMALRLIPSDRAKTKQLKRMSGQHDHIGSPRPVPADGSTG